MLGIEEIFLDHNRRRVFGYPVVTMDEYKVLYHEARKQGCPLNEHSLDPVNHTVDVVTTKIGGLPFINEIEARQLEQAINTLAKFMNPAKKVPYEGVK